jgi:hypothetical protein
MARMVRKQVYLTAEQDEKIRRLAAGQRRPEAELIRDALDQMLESASAARARFDKDPLWDIVGIGRSGRGDVSANVDAYLYGDKR